MTKYLLTLYTRTPLHVGCGTSVDVVDLPLMRERITNFPVIPSTSLKGVLRESSRQCFGKEKANVTRVLYGEDRKIDSDDGEGGKVTSFAGCLQIMEAKLLAFPVRSLAGCFAWLTCPAVLRRFRRDTGIELMIPSVEKDQAVVDPASELIVGEQKKVILEEYALTAVNDSSNGHSAVIDGLKGIVEDSLWENNLAKRLVILHDDDFQHFVSICTEVVARIAIDPATRINTSLFNQENIPCETLFYSILTVLNPRQKGFDHPVKYHLEEQLKTTPTLQIGGDETSGHGFCAVLHKDLSTNA